MGKVREEKDVNQRKYDKKKRNKEGKYLRERMKGKDKQTIKWKDGKVREEEDVNGESMPKKKKGNKV